MTIVDNSLRTEDAPDVWTQRWGDQALQRLGRWLTSHGVSDSRAAMAVDGIWVFYSYFALPILGHHLPMAIAADRFDEHNTVIVVLPSPDTPGSPVQPQQVEALVDAFNSEVATLLAPKPALDLTFGHFGSVAMFEQTYREAGEQPASNILGVFTDNLREELTKVMRADAIGPWLHTPNEQFGGRKPAEYIDDSAADRPIRDLILAIKHGLFA